MAEKKPAKKATPKSAKYTIAAAEPSKGVHGRGTSRDARARKGVEDRDAPRPARGKRDRRRRRAREDRRDDDKVVCFFQSAQKFKTRYATLGFSDKAALDEGTMWPTAFALKALSVADEARIGALVKKAVS